jgi:hypothetical protein
VFVDSAFLHEGRRSPSRTWGRARRGRSI